MMLSLCRQRILNHGTGSKSDRLDYEHSFVFEHSFVLQHLYLYDENNPRNNKFCKVFKENIFLK